MAVRRAVTQAGKPAGPKVSEKRGGHLHRDPVCGTFVPAENALTRESGGQTLYFCSEACRDRFVA
jgi:YHS domain-containing protein